MPRVTLKSGAIRDQIRKDLFDSIEQADGANLLANQKFFTNTSGKNSAQTNLKTNNQFENQVSFLVQGIGFDAQVQLVANEAVLPSIMEHSSLSLDIGEKTYWEGSLRYIAGKVVQEGGFLQQFGSHDDSKYKLVGQDSIAIPPLQRFELSWNVFGAGLTTAPAGEAVTYMCRLMGLQRRPVQ
jgi:hypothetical protein